MEYLNSSVCIGCGRTVIAGSCLHVVLYDGAGEWDEDNGVHDFGGICNGCTNILAGRTTATRDALASVVAS